MRFMLMFKSDKPVEHGTSPCKRELPEMGKLMKELTDAGVIVATEGLMPSDFGARVKYDGGGKHLVTRRPVRRGEGDRRRVRRGRRRLEGRGGRAGQAVPEHRRRGRKRRAASVRAFSPVTDS